ncbi:S1 family peptidase [Botrimarina hoheduenensis]|nr:serine protease [Botrimarina hoheduenensis]
MARIGQKTATGSSLGTCTLIAHRGDLSYFLTCAHVFEGNGPIEIGLQGQPALPGKLLSIDRQHDLALVATRRVAASPAPIEAIHEDTPSAGLLTACGYGPTGMARCVRGPVLGLARPEGAVFPSLRLRGQVRPGDSGGPVLNAAGRLVGVVWGARQGETYATFGRPLQRLLGRLPESDAALPVEVPASAPQEETQPRQLPLSAAWSSGIEERLAASDRRLVDLDQRVSEGFTRIDTRLAELTPRGDRHAENDRAEQRDEFLRERLERLAEGATTIGNAARSAGRVEWLAALLGVGTPAVGLMAAALWWRKRRSTAATAGNVAGATSRPIAIDTAPPPQQSIRETHYVPYATDEFAKAHQWAGEQLARKFPGSVEWLTSLDSLIRQQLAGRKE